MKNRCGDAAVEKTNYHPPSPNPSVGPAPVARAEGRDSAERGYPEQKIIKSLVGVYLKVLRGLRMGRGGGAGGEQKRDCG